MDQQMVVLAAHLLSVFDSKSPAFITYTALNFIWEKINYVAQ